jgi:putative transposase
MILGGAALTALRYIVLWKRAASAAEVIMAAPPRGNTGRGCYFITASTFQKRQLLQSDRMADLFLNVLFKYRQQRKFLLHEFVIMPDHFHLLITPTESLERALQLIKGGFSYRAKKELGFIGEVWQPSYHDRRVRDLEEYLGFRKYIHMNPLRKKMVSTPAEYRYSSAHPRFELDCPPQRLKPAA